MKYSKCAWFAPVSIIINLIAYYIYRSILTMCMPLSSSLGQTVYGQEAVEQVKRSYLINAVSSIVPIILILIVSSVLFLIAFNKIDQNAKTACMPLILVPCFLFPITTAVGTILNCIVYHISEDLYTSSWAYEIGLFISNIIITVLSYFIVSTYLKKLENSVSENYSNNSDSSSTNESVSVNSYVTSSKSKAVAGLLCFFLGVFGIHRFYVGKVGTGILWLLTGGLFGIGAFIDFFIIIFGGFKDSSDQSLS